MPELRSSLRPIGRIAVAGFVALMMGTLPGSSALFAAEGAKDIVFKVDTERSRARFTLGATLHTVEGKASSVSGTLVRTVGDPPAAGAQGGAGSPVGGRIVIVARALDTGNASRDKRMRAETLAVDRYPEIVFSPKRAVGPGFDWTPGRTVKFSLEGNLTLRGKTRPVSIVVSARMEERRIVADGETTLVYGEWGVPDPSNLFLRVQPSVRVHLHIEARTQ